jgi:2-polyprenyl-6-methoxyphenol hydroxylase-like FAD-dependent oxidoreductase
MSKPKIAIVGAGPAGLTLARVLLIHGMHSTVLERESSFQYRSQGGSLDIHADSGQLALARAALTEEFRKIARYEDQEGRIYDRHGRLRLLDRDVEDHERPETDRGHLRQMLLDSLPSGIVRWNSPVHALEPQLNGTCSIVFADGSRENFDLVVGADGTWSKVRPVLSDAMPEYSGILFVEMGIDDVDRRYPAISELVGHGLTFALGDAMGLLMHRNANAHIGFYAAFRSPVDLFAGHSDQDIRAALLDRFADWGLNLRELIQQADEIVAVRGIYSLPSGHRWKHLPGVTMIGDAAHVMSPFGGDGANFAMLDAAELGEVLLHENWRVAIPAFEEQMMKRAEDPSAMAWQALQKTFAPDGLEHSLAMMQA